MSIDSLFASRTLETLKRGLDAFSLRGHVIADNVANAGTEGYRAKSVAFEDDLRRALGSAGSASGPAKSPGQIPLGSSSLGTVAPRVIESSYAALPGEPNNVVIESEMANLAQNEILFDFAARQIAGSYRTMKAAIRGTMR
ncbi:MAG: flagellar basal body rod protein FlgB [bacterium]